MYIWRKRNIKRVRRCIVAESGSRPHRFHLRHAGLGVLLRTRRCGFIVGSHAPALLGISTLLTQAARAGMHHALLLAAPHASVVQAFEISDIANDVYEHNHGFRPWQGNIEAVRTMMRTADAMLLSTCHGCMSRPASHACATRELP